MEVKNSGSNVMGQMNEFSFSIEKLKKLWVEDLEKMDLSCIKQDKVYEKICRTKMASKDYLEKTLFKHGTQHSFIGSNGELTTFDAEGYCEWKMIPKDLKRWYTEEVLPFKVISEINAPALDFENRTINTFPAIRFNGETIVKKESLFVSEWVNNYLKHFICDGNEVLFEWILDYLYCLLHGIRTEMIPYLYGEEGTGKSMFIKTAINLLGRKRCKKASVKKFTAEFTEFKKDKQLITVEETVDLKGKSNQTAFYSEAMTDIKDSCTDSYSEIHAKFKGDGDQKIFINIIMSSNYLLEAKDLKGRRFVIMNVASKKKIGMSEEEYNKINDEERAIFSLIGDTLEGCEKGDQKCIEELEQLFKFIYDRKPKSTKLYQTQPPTSIKKDVADDAEYNSHKFIKNELQKGTLKKDEERTALYQRYCSFCKDKLNHPASTTLFYSQIRLLECKEWHSNKDRFFGFDVEKLKKNLKIDGPKDEGENVNEYDNGIEDIDFQVKDAIQASNRNLMEKNKQLEERIKELEALLSASKGTQSKVIQKEEETIKASEKELKDVRNVLKNFF